MAMAIQGGLPVAHGAVFPNGAFVVGEVTAMEDFDAAQAAKASGAQVDTQIRDKQSGMRVWQVRVVDADDLARKGQVEVTVKIAAEVQPVPPELANGVPFRPVEFDNLTATPYIDQNRSRPRIAWSLKATGMHAPGKGLRSAHSQPPAGDSNKVA
jgi:hypothetical protein